MTAGPDFARSRLHGIDWDGNIYTVLHNGKNELYHCILAHRCHCTVIFASFNSTPKQCFNRINAQLHLLPAVCNTSASQQRRVTGANVGLGYEAAKHFVSLHANKIILACRDVDKGEAARQSIQQETGSSNNVLEVWKLDYSSYDSVKAFAERVQGLARLDTVVENAGINTRKWKMLEENESQITVNVVSTLLLAHLLLPKLRESAKATGNDGRLVIVGSEVYQWARFDERHSKYLFDALNSEKQSTIGDR